MKIVRGREAYTKGSGITSYGTDEQELYMRLRESDEQAHLCNIQNIERCVLS